MAQVRRTPLAEQAADLLLERIRGGEWALGAKLPGESTLGPQLGVGRSTVREAIRRLAGQGVLATRQGAGVFVASLDVLEDWRTSLSTADITSVLEARIAIEVEAAALAAVRRSPPSCARSGVRPRNGQHSAASSRRTSMRTSPSTAASSPQRTTRCCWTCSTASPRAAGRR